MTIVASNSLTLSNVNDGTITHTAYSYSADGTDGFTTVYPNLNLFEGSKKYTKDNPKTVSSSAADGWVWVDDVFIKNLKAGTYTISCKADVPFISHSQPASYKQGKVGLWLISTQTWEWINFDTVPKTFEVHKDGDYFIRVNTYSNGTDIETHSFWDFKLDQGSTATPHMPSASEVKTSDYPSYIGQYTDFTQADSTNPSAYTWSLFKGNDSNAYTAYSWSEDGKDRFTTDYPNLNLLDGTKDFSGVWYNSDNWYKSDTYKGLSVMSSEGLYNVGITKPFIVPSDGIYSLSMFIKVKTGCIGQFIIESTGRPAIIIDVTDTKGEFVTQSYTGTFTTGQEILMYFRFNNDRTLVKDGLSVAGHKIELGSTATPWMPSVSEAQAQWQDAIPMYVGVGDKASLNPSDYRWQLNPRYVQASSDSGLSNKADNDDLASVADTANDALVQAQNAVSNEDYTSWLEHDYQNTISNLQDVSRHNREDVNNVSNRTTIVEGFYNDMKVKWNFIDESFTFSEEGMFISNAQSKMSIQVTSDKIVFWDNNVDVAFITGEVLNIQKGVFLESATIGNHLITKFSNESPVTIIRYVGGIT